MTAVGGTVTAAAALAVAGSDEPRTLAAGTTRRSVHTPGLQPGEPVIAARDTGSLTRSASGVLIPTSEAIIAENVKPGHLWWVTTAQAAGDIEGYVSQVSAVVGDTVTLHVSTRASSFHVEAYRMGYYGGIGARLVWQSPEVPGVRQPPPTLTLFVNTIECQWPPPSRCRSMPAGPPAPTC